MYVYAKMYTHRTVGRVWLESRMRCTSGVSVSANSRPPTLAMHARESPCARGGVGVCVVRTSASRRGPHIRVRRGPPASAMHGRESPRHSRGNARVRVRESAVGRRPYVNSRPARVGGQGEPPRVRGRRRARVSAHVRVRLRGHKPVRTSFVYAQRVAALTYISSRRPSGTSQLYCVHI